MSAVSFPMAGAIVPAGMCGQGACRSAGGDMASCACACVVKKATFPNEAWFRVEVSINRPGPTERRQAKQSYPKA